MRLETAVTTSVKDIRNLRERLGVGILEAKVALEASGGDLLKAEEFLAEKSRARADKLSEKTASNGLVVATAQLGLGALLTVNCETDFVAKNSEFQEFARNLLGRAVTENISEASELERVASEDISVMSSKFGEKIAVSDLKVLDLSGVGMGTYLHYSSPDLPAKMAAVIAFTVEKGVAHRDVSKTVREVAMQVVATSPQFVSTSSMLDGALDSWGEEFRVAALASGKPAGLVEKIVQGQVQKRVSERVLLEQDWLRAPGETVGSVAARSGINIINFISSSV